MVPYSIDDSSIYKLLDIDKYILNSLEKQVFNILVYISDIHIFMSDKKGSTRRMELDVCDDTFNFFQIVIWGENLIESLLNRIFVGCLVLLTNLEFEMKDQLNIKYGVINYFSNTIIYVITDNKNKFLLNHEAFPKLFSIYQSLTLFYDKIFQQNISKRSKYCRKLTEIKSTPYFDFEIKLIHQDILQTNELTAFDFQMRKLKIILSNSNQVNPINNKLLSLEYMKKNIMETYNI